jgi:hypothetical protein
MSRLNAEGHDEGIPRVRQERIFYGKRIDFPKRLQYKKVNPE